MILRLDLNTVTDEKDLLGRSLTAWQFPKEKDLDWKRWWNILVRDISLPSIELTRFEGIITNSPNLLKRFLGCLLEFRGDDTGFDFSLLDPCRQLLESPASQRAMPVKHRDVKCLIHDTILNRIPRGLKKIDYQLQNQNLELCFGFDSVDCLVEGILPLMDIVGTIRSQLRWHGAVGARFSIITF